MEHQDLLDIDSTGKTRTAREYEVVLWGATGFTGSLVARHLVDTYGDDLKWAIAGRNLTKLESLREELGQPHLPLILADSSDSESLKAMAERALSIPVALILFPVTWAHFTCSKICNSPLASTLTVSKHGWGNSAAVPVEAPLPA